jgi:thymidylate synthase
MSMNECFKNSVLEIITNGIEVSPRGIKTKELIAPRIVLENPRDRIVTFEERSTDIFYAVGEFFWYLSGSNKLDFIKYYAPSIGKFSDDCETLNSAYGYNIFSRWGDQWLECINILRNDKDSRHAVIFIREPNDVMKNTKDSICTNCVMFLIRENRLHMTVSMRSNDLFVGGIFDFFCFTMLQELMSIELGVELGHYVHVPNSLHIYENWFEVAKKIMNSGKSVIDGEMKPMKFMNEDMWDEIADVLKYEKMIRTEPIEIVGVIKEELEMTIGISHYWVELLTVLIFKRFFIEEDYNKCEEIIQKLNNKLFAELLRRKLIAQSKKTA